jgi:hypothetical protein
MKFEICPQAVVSAFDVAVETVTVGRLVRPPAALVALATGGAACRVLNQTKSIPATTAHATTAAITTCTFDLRGEWFGGVGETPGVKPAGPVPGHVAPSPYCAGGSGRSGYGVYACADVGGGFVGAFMPGYGDHGKGAADDDAALVSWVKSWPQRAHC